MAWAEVLITRTVEEIHKVYVDDDDYEEYRDGEDHDDLMLEGYLTSHDGWENDYFALDARSSESVDLVIDGAELKSER